MLATTLESMVLPLTIGAGAALLAWLIVLAVVAVANRPNRAEPVSAGLELGGDSPPAVAAMLSHRWKPDPVGPAATLIDLAARDLVRFEPMSAGGYQVRVPDQPPPPDLLDYEAHVLELVRSRASNGVVPCAALQVGATASQSTSTLMFGSKAIRLSTTKTANWFKRFDQMVSADARRRGLSRARFSRAVIAFLGAAATIPALLVGLAVVALPNDSTATDCVNCAQSSDNPFVGTLVVALFVWIGLMLIFRRLQDDRDTPAGLAEAGRWLGLRGNLRNDEVFGEHHVDAVVIWDRLLAYGVALGVAHVAAADVPISPESKREAWSAESGTWRLVHIDYPKRLPPGYGKPTWLALLTGLFQVGIAGVVLVFGVPSLLHFATEVSLPTSDLNGDSATTVHLVLRVVAGVVAVGVGLALVRALAMVWFAANDLGARRVVDGLVLRSYSHTSNDQDWWEAAVDDGTDDQVRAWRGQGQLPAALQEGNRVRATITRHLCTFKSAEVLGPTPPPAPTNTPNPY